MNGWNQTVMQTRQKNMLHHFKSALTSVSARWGLRGLTEGFIPYPPILQRLPPIVFREKRQDSIPTCFRPMFFLCGFTVYRTAAMIRQAAGLRPGRAVQEGLAELCRDPCNIVFVVSGRGKDELQAAFGHIKVTCDVNAAHTPFNGCLLRLEAHSCSSLVGVAGAESIRRTDVVTCVIC